MGKRKGTDPPLWISEKDEQDQPVEQRVIDAAHRIWKQVLRYIREAGQEPTDAAEILEAVAHSVSSAIRQKEEGELVHNLESYLFWSFVREYAEQKRREFRLQYLGNHEALETLQSDDLYWVSWLENEILLEQLAAHMDSKTRRMFARRILGYSWAEIGRQFGISAHNAEVQFSYGLKIARRRLFGSRSSDSPKRGSGKES